MLPLACGVHVTQHAAQHGRIGVEVASPVLGLVLELLERVAVRRGEVEL